MRPAGATLVAGLFLMLCVTPTSAQHGDYRGPQGYRSGPGAPPTGMSPYGPTRSGAPTSPYGSRNYPNQPVPSTRFAPIPEGSRTERMNQPSYRGPSGPQYNGPSGAPTVIPYNQSQTRAERPDSPSVRSRADELQRMSPDLSVQDRLKVPLIRTMYRQGENMVDEGRSSGDESKVRMGTQQINEANERVKRLEQQYGSGPDSANRGNRGNNGRRDRR